MKKGGGIPSPSPPRRAGSPAFIHRSENDVLTDFAQQTDKLEFAEMRCTIPSPGGKGDREAVDEEWRYLTILNAVKSKSTAFPNVPF